MTSRVVLDVWGGPLSQEHMARKVCDQGEALKLADKELSAGFLVNMRVSDKHNSTDDFDSRVPESDNLWAASDIERHTKEDEADYGHCRH